MNVIGKDLAILIPKDVSISEIHRLARLFHQDFDLMGLSIDDAVIEFLNSLSRLELVSLRKDLQNLIDENPGEKQKGLRKAWLRLGAQWWDNRKDLRASITHWINEIK